MSPDSPTNRSPDSALKTCVGCCPPSACARGVPTGDRHAVLEAGPVQDVMRPARGLCAFRGDRGEDDTKMRRSLHRMPPPCAVMCTSGSTGCDPTVTLPELPERTDPAGKGEPRGDMIPRPLLASATSGWKRAVSILAARTELADCGGVRIGAPAAGLMTTPRRVARGVVAAGAGDFWTRRRASPWPAALQQLQSPGTRLLSSSPAIADAGVCALQPSQFTLEPVAADGTGDREPRTQFVGKTVPRALLVFEKVPS